MLNKLQKNKITGIFSFLFGTTKSSKSLPFEGKELIWLENVEGKKISAENTAYTEDIDKSLRAIYAGHEIEIKIIKKDRNYYTLEIGKKNNS